MGNVQRVPVYKPNPTTPAPDPELKQVISEPRPYKTQDEGLDPLPKDCQDEDAKSAKSKRRLLRSAMRPEANTEPVSDQLRFSVEAILHRRTRRKRIEYFVKWENCPEEAETYTWEPAEHLKRFPDLMEDFDREWLAKRLEKKRKNIPKPGPGRGWKSRQIAARTAREARWGKLEKKKVGVEPATVVEEAFDFDQ